MSAKNKALIKGVDIENIALGELINFSKHKSLSFNTPNIKNCTLTGKIGLAHKLNKTNIVFCRVQHLEGNSADFTSVDFKDSLIADSKFTKCIFNESAFINNSIENTVFVGCSFNMTSITGSQFSSTIFESCDLTNVVINTCQFFNCTFRNCKTNNKVIEMSFLYESYFYNTNIHIETVLENFGLGTKSIKNAGIKINNKYYQKGAVLNKQFKNIIVSDSYSNIEKFKIAYFENEAILSEGSDYIDLTFNPQNWIELCAIPKSFSLLIENYHDFLMKNFDENKMPAWNLLKLHSMTGVLLEQNIANPEILRSISGMHLSLSRFVEYFLNILTKEITATEKGRIILLVNGPLNKDFYVENLKPLFEGSNLKIEEVIKHNSPNELILSWVTVKDLVPVIAVFLATRFKVEFEKQKKTKSKVVAVTKTKKLTASASSESLKSFSLELGFDKNESFLYQLKLKVLTPGDLLVNLQLGFNTKMFGKMKKILVDLLSSTDIVKK